MLQRYALLSAAALAALAGCGSGNTRMANPAARGPQIITMDAVQRWWRGADVSLKRDVYFGSRSDGKGVWTAHVSVPRPDKKLIESADTDFHIYMSLSGSAQGFLRRGTLPAGTRAISSGWGVDKQKWQLGAKPFLYMRLRLGEDGDLDLTFQCEHWRTLLSGSNDCSIEGMLRRAEPYLRAHFFDLSRVPTPAEPAPSASIQPSLTLLAVSASPAEARRGSAVDLVLNYKLEGVDGSTQVSERRIVSVGDLQIADLPTTVSRAAGSYTSSQRLSVPAQASPGVYKLRVAISAGGMTAEGSALFEVK